MSNVATIRRPEEFAIEKGIPKPIAHGSQLFPFPDMEVGDSFAFPSTLDNRVRTAACNWGKTHGGKKFSVRKYGNGHRCWRIA